MTIIFVLELAAGVTGYILKGSTYSLIKNSLQPTMIDYTNSTQIALNWDNVQETFECCGLDNYEDWMKALDGVPISCCNIPHGVLSEFFCNGTADTLHKHGCVQAFGDYIKSHALSLALAGVVLAVIQLFGLLFACFIARQIKKSRVF